MALTGILQRYIDAWLPMQHPLDGKAKEYLNALRDQLESLDTAQRWVNAPEVAVQTQNLDFDIADGYRDGVLEVIGNGPTTGATSFCGLQLRPVGGAFTALTPQNYNQQDGGAVAVGANSPIATGTGSMFFRALIQLRTGMLRSAEVNTVINTGAGTSKTKYDGAARFGDNSADVVDAIRLAGGAANCFQPGYRVAYRKIPV